jgi:hypothetical protein
VGLVAREIEAAGITTVTLSMVPDFTAAVGAPRVAAIAHPCGVPLGRPGDDAGQRAVLAATLHVAERATRPGQVIALPFVWPDPPRASRFEPAEPPPIAQLLKRQPWQLRRLYAGDIPPHDRPPHDASSP